MKREAPYPTPLRYSRARTRLFRLLAVLLAPLTLFAVLEAALRLAGFGYATGFTRPCGSATSPARCDNPSFTWQFFPRKIARTPVAFSFPRAKPAGTFRVFVVGGSAAQGDPEPSYGMARMLEVMLRERYPALRFEVINAGVTAINSHVVLPMVRDLARYEPDAFVVYLGNNEVVGPFGAGTVFAPLTRSRLLIRANLWLGRTRVGQLATALLGTGDGPDEWRGMEMFLDHRLREDDPRLESVYRHFGDNLAAIARIGHRAGARVLLSTVGTNLRDSAPFASLHGDGMSDDERARFDEALRAGVRAAAAGDRSGAQRAYRLAAELEPGFAELHFRVALLTLDSGADEAALHALGRARDADALRFRADTRINAVVRSIPGRLGAAAPILVDSAVALKRSAARQGMPGAELLHDHVHLNFAGNHVVAGELLAALESSIPAAPATQDPASREQCAARLAHSGFDRRRVLELTRERTARAPFTARANQSEELARIDSELATLAHFGTAAGMSESAAVYRKAVGAAPGDPWLRFNEGVLLDAMGDPTESAQSYRAFLALLPHDVPGREKLSAALAAGGRFDDAVAECRRLITAVPEFTPPYYTLAYALTGLGRLDESLDVYRRLLEIDPGSHGEVYNEIGRIQLHREALDQAVDAFSRAVEASLPAPAPDLRYNLAVALRRQGREAEARTELELAQRGYLEQIERDGSTLALQLALGGVRVELGDLAAAASSFGEAARLAPDNLDAHVKLVRALELQGLSDEAVAACRRALAAMNAAGRTRGVELLARRLAALEAAAGR